MANNTVPYGDDELIQRIFVGLARGERFDDILKAAKVADSTVMGLVSNPDLLVALQTAQRAQLVIAADDAIRHLRQVVRTAAKTEGDKARRLEAAKAILDRAGHSAGQAKNAADTAAKPAKAPSVAELESMLQQAKGQAANAARNVGAKVIDAQVNAQGDSEPIDILS